IAHQRLDPLIDAVIAAKINLLVFRSTHSHTPVNSPSSSFDARDRKEETKKSAVEGAESDLYSALLDIGLKAGRAESVLKKMLGRAREEAGFIAGGNSPTGYTKLAVDDLLTPRTPSWRALLDRVVGAGKTGLREK